jgi:hypothetical protein
MLIALDYDKTYTAAPCLWDRFIADAIDSGHSVVIVTMRYPTEEIPDVGIPVVYTSRSAKSKVVKADIWIDDSPHWIYEDSL